MSILQLICKATIMSNVRAELWKRSVNKIMQKVDNAYKQRYFGFIYCFVVLRNMFYYFDKTKYRTILQYIF